MFCQLGPLVKEIVSHYKDHVQAKLVPSTRKVFMYSAHDTTIAVFLSALQIFNNIQPPYSSLVMVELHQAVNTSDYYVQVSCVAFIWGLNLVSFHF